MCKRTITSEFVSWGHPDKIADQVSDAILDALIEGDKKTRAGIEVMVKDNIVVLGGEVSSNAEVNYDAVVRQVYSTLPFPKDHHLSPSEIKVINLIGKQSVEIHSGVDKSETNIGAGDQGFMCGFASADTKVLMPLGHYLAKVICQGVVSYSPKDYGPDAKSQVTVEYDDETHESVVKSILVSTMHSCDWDDCRHIVKRMILDNKLGIDTELFDRYINGKDIEIDVNPCGSWRTGGPVSDCGVTGRKIVVDQFGGYCSVGGGCINGKDLTKVDRSAAYMCRYIAKNIVAAGLCHDCKVELAYKIGVAQPSAINITLSDSEWLTDAVTDWVKENLDLTPYGIIKRFNNGELRFQWLAKFGSYGYNERHEDDVEIMLRPWEKTDLAVRMSNEILC